MSQELVQAWKQFNLLQSQWLRKTGKSPDDYRNLLISRGIIQGSRSELYREDRIEDLRRLSSGLEFDLLHFEND